MIANLSRERLLLCDLHPSRILINATSRSAILSVGKVQWTYGKERFHSGAPCFIDVQCEACFKTSKSQSMDWLPEASCNQDTKKCMVRTGAADTAGPDCCAF